MEVAWWKGVALLNKGNANGKLAIKIIFTKSQPCQFPFILRSHYDMLSERKNRHMYTVTVHKDEQARPLVAY